MQTLTNQQELPDDGGVKLVNIDPKNGTFNIYKRNPDGSYPSTPFKSVDNTSEPIDTIFYAPTPKGLFTQVNWLQNGFWLRSWIIAATFHEDGYEALHFAGRRMCLLIHLSSRPCAGI